jgi:hypothetical protein
MMPGKTSGQNQLSHRTLSPQIYADETQIRLFTAEAQRRGEEIGVMGMNKNLVTAELITRPHA